MSVDSQRKHIDLWTLKVSLSPNLGLMDPPRYCSNQKLRQRHIFSLPSAGIYSTGPFTLISTYVHAELRLDAGFCVYTLQFQDDHKPHSVLLWRRAEHSSPSIPHHLSSRSMTLTDRWHTWNDQTSQPAWFQTVDVNTASMYPAYPELGVWHWQPWVSVNGPNQTQNGADF